MLNEIFKAGDLKENTQEVNELNSCRQDILDKWNDYIKIGDARCSENKSSDKLAMIKPMKKGHFYWAEVSGAIEHWFKQNNGYPIPNIYVSELIRNPDSVKSFSDDGYHYERCIGPQKDLLEKCIFGFRDKDIMQKLDRDFCFNGFQSYDDFRQYVNSRNSKKNEAKIRAKSLVDTKEKWAIQFIETLWEYYGNGLHELTIYMSDALHDALNTLEVSQTLPYSKLYLKKGKDLQSFMTPLVFHEMGN